MLMNARDAVHDAYDNFCTDAAWLTHVLTIACVLSSNPCILIPTTKFRATARRINVSCNVHHWKLIRSNKKIRYLALV